LLAGIAGTTIGLGMVSNLNRELDGRNTKLREANRNLIAANEAVEKQRNAFEFERDRAEGNLTLASDAVNQTVAKVVENPQLRQGNFQVLRRDLLALAVPFYEKFVEQRRDDPKLEAERGRTYDRLALIRIEMGDFQAALADYERVRDIFEKLAADWTAVPEYRELLVRSLVHMGIVLGKLNKLQEAELAVRQALATQEKLVADYLGNGKYRRNLAVILGNLGTYSEGSRRYKEAEALHRQALEIQEKLTSEFAENDDYRAEVARSQNNLGRLYTKTGQKMEAESALRRALAVEEDLLAKNPTAPSLREALAFTNFCLGALFRKNGRPQEALENAERAVTTLEKLCSEYPNISNYRLSLAGGRNLRASLHSDGGRHDLALEDLDRAEKLLKELLQQSDNVASYYRELAALFGNRARALAASGRGSQSAEALAQAINAGAKAAKLDAEGTRNWTAIQFGQWSNQSEVPKELQPAPKTDKPR
jgi:tetratricopeptide (TPR) repeat protein